MQICSRRSLRLLTLALYLSFQCVTTQHNSTHQNTYFERVFSMSCLTSAFKTYQGMNTAQGNDLAETLARAMKARRVDLQDDDDDGIDSDDEWSE